MRYVTMGFLLSFLLCQASANADNLPEGLFAVGIPESMLAGIKLKTTKLSDVIRMYGQPTRKREVPNNPVWTGYAWELPHAKLELGISRGSSDPLIEDIYVEGNSDGKIGSTRQGLKLGDDIMKLKRVYGTLFLLQNLMNDHSEKRMEFTGVSVAHQRAIIQWGLEGVTLTVGFDDHGKINAMWLDSGCE